MNKEQNDYLTDAVTTITLHLFNCYGLEEVEQEDDYYGTGDDYGFNFIHKLLLCLLKSVGLLKWADDLLSEDKLRSDFYLLLDEFGITYSFGDICYEPEPDEEDDIIDPKNNEKWRKAIGEQLDQLDDPALKDIIMDQLTNWTYNSDIFFYYEDPDCRSDILKNANFLYVEVSRELSDQYSFFMENCSPSTLAWYIGKRESEKTVTYVYMGPAEYWLNEGYYRFFVYSKQVFNLTFFFPLIEYMSGKKKC